MSSSKLQHLQVEVDAELFNTPTDLVCPITQDLFHHPVLNSLGMVYERDAISAYMRERVSDPVTNMPLPSPTLTPVFPIKSRAMEYRERTAKLCVQRACSGPEREGGSVSVVDPVRYVRRAAELCARKEFQVPGLSWECVEYLNAHASNAYDSQGLELFASGLREAGFHQEAANVYMRLLENSDGDQELQTRALQQCLACWFPQEGRSGEGLHDRHWDKDVVPRLTTFVTAQHTFSAAQFVEVMVEARLPDILVLQLIEHLMAQVEDQGSGEASRVVACQGQLLLKYTQLMCRQFPQEAVDYSGGRRGMADGNKLGHAAFATGPHPPLALRFARSFLRTHRRTLSRAAFFALAFVKDSHPVLTALKAASAIILANTH